MNTFSDSMQSFTPEEPSQNNQQNNANSDKRKGNPVPKLKYFWKEGPRETKNLNLVALAVGIIMAALVLFTGISATNSHIMDLPVIKMIFPEYELTQARNEFDHIIEEVDKAIENSDQETIREFEKEFGISIEEMRDALDPPSLKNLSKLGAGLKNTEIGDVAGIFTMLSTSLIAFAAFICLLVALSLYLVSKGLMIFSYILSAAFLILMGGIVVFLIATALLITYIVLASKLKSQYKKYLASFK